MVDIRSHFMAFYHKYRKRRFAFEKKRFLRDYLAIFLSLRYPIDICQNYTIIGDINKAKIIIACRYDTRKELWVKRHKEYLCPKRKGQKIDYHKVDLLLRCVMITIMLCIIYAMIGYNLYLAILSVYVSLFVLIGSSNKKNFSSTINLYIIKQLAIKEFITDKVVFVIYDKEIPIDVFSDHQLIIILDHCAYGNIIGIQTDQDIKHFESSIIKILNNNGLIHPLSHYLIINTGFCDDAGFYRLYVDTKQDTSLNITLYREITQLLKHLIYKSYQA